MKKHSARVAPLSACNSPVLTLTKVEGNGPGRRGLARGLCARRGAATLQGLPGRGCARSPGTAARSAAPHAASGGWGGGDSPVAPGPGCPRAVGTQGWPLPARPLAHLAATVAAVAWAPAHPVLRHLPAGARGGVLQTLPSALQHPHHTCTVVHTHTHKPLESPGFEATPPIAPPPPRQTRGIAPLVGAGDTAGGRVLSPAPQA